MSPKFRVVVAEDDASIRDLIRSILEMSGYEVHTAKTGFEAVQKVDMLRPNAVILDINMPELDGFGVLEALKVRPQATRTPVLMLTARHAGEDVRRAVGLGAKDYLTKPFSQGQLLARVARLLRAPVAAPSSL
ncbi:response regulator transcription factor [Caulobacter sp. S45]|uniref:response regulator transcription factor n=1 Tax=Caulobacter sp. S45 TaxID=1641861 RepID=UPI00131BC413|nr:response regulator transcription factor [Caulobacter sp. S45]